MCQPEGWDRTGCYWRHVAASHLTCNVILSALFMYTKSIKCPGYWGGAPTEIQLLDKKQQCWTTKTNQCWHFFYSHILISNERKWHLKHFPWNVFWHHFRANTAHVFFNKSERINVNKDENSDPVYEIRKKLLPVLHVLKGHLMQQVAFSTFH